MKKLFAVLMAIALVFSMGTIAFAADTGSITITNAVEGVTYKVYKILDFVPSNSEGTAGRYTVDSDWDIFFNGGSGNQAYFDVIENDGETVVTLKEGATISQDLAKSAVAFAQKEGGVIAPEATATAGADGKVEFTGLPLGYYAIDTSLGTLCALTNTNSDFTAVEKNEKPDLVKKIVEGTDLVDANNVKVGDTVTYQATIEIGAGMENYIMHDKMSDGLSFKEIVSINTRKSGAVIGDVNYTVKNSNTETIDDGCTFEIVFDNEFTSALDADDAIIVTYTATLNGAAAMGNTGNPNEAWLQYNNDQFSTHDYVITYTTSFTVEKVDGDGNPLAGAGFTLYKDGVAIGNEIVFTSLEEGKKAIYEWTGLEAGNYKLVETTVPAGYNKAADIEFVIACKVPETVTSDDDEAVWSVDEDTIIGNTNGVFDTTVENKAGSLLPETGGIGTTIFYVVGGLLMVAAFVVLVSKKRMKSVA